MTARKVGEPAPPIIRHAPLGELKVYTVYEHELESLAEGSPASLLLNFALVLLPISLSLFANLVLTPVPEGRIYQAFVCISTITLISGVVLLALWFNLRTASKAIVRTIKNRMPPAEGIQEATPSD